MKFLKGFGLSLLGLVLSLALVVLGLSLTINSTVLNPRFTRTAIQELDIPALVEQLAPEPSGEPSGNGEIPPEELMKAVTDTVIKLEPLVKERLTAATDSVYDYLLGRRPAPDLVPTLRNTILKKDFFVAVLDKVDLSPFLKELLTERLPIGNIPAEFQGYVDEGLDVVVADLKPWFKQQVETGVDPLLDYLVGESDTFSLVLRTDELKTRLVASLRKAVTESPPPELAGIPQALWQGQLDQFLREFSAQIPPSLVINENALGPDARTGIVSGLKESEEVLVRARGFVSLFQTVYRLLVVLVLLCVVGIIAIHRQVKGASRDLGIIFLSYGVLQYAGVLIGRYFASTQVALEEVPPSLQLWVTNLTNRLFDPLGTFSLALLIAGMALLVVSFVYPRLRARG